MIQYRIAVLFYTCIFWVIVLEGVLTQTTSEWRLSKNVTPDEYSILIQPYLQAEDGVKQFTFDGQVNISLHAVVNNIKEITLHKDYINITDCILYNSAGQTVQTFKEEDLLNKTEFDKMTLPLNSALTANASYTLTIAYQGQIRNGQAGFFRLNYTDESGSTKWIGVTQMQRINARTVFPCFDEPDFKAKFKMQILRSKSYKSYFNTKLLNTISYDNNWELDSFDETPLMSTYLVAFIVSDFITHGTDDLKIVISPKFLNKINFSYDVAQKTLKAYDDYIQIPYKTLGNAVMQKAGVPSFPHNGMENWGLVIYHDSVLVHEPNYTDGWATKQHTISIIMHETSHMWFGDSVTFAWWSYFWLNEAFARYCEYFMSNEVYPEYQLDQQFIVKQVHLIFGTDALNSTQPLTTPESLVETPSQIASKFSGITYAKGATILRSIINLMGKQNFDNAIRDYLKANHLKNTVPEDLFLHLREHWPASHEVDLNTFFHDWTEQVGFPMLIVNSSLSGNEVKLQQRRFLLEPTDGSDATLRYTIPITYATDKNPNFNDLTPKFYLNKSNTDFVITFEQPIEWVIFNLQQSNYYRVFYDSTLLKQISIALGKPDHSGINVINRAQLVDDIFNFGRVGLLQYDEVFEFLEYLIYETEYLPWAAAFKGLERVAQRITVKQLKNFNQFLSDITANVYKKLGFENSNDTILDVYSRNNVISWLCKYRHEDCNQKAEEYFTKGMNESKKPSPDFRSTLYCSAIRFHVFNYYEYINNMFIAENLTSEKELLMSSMGCTYHFAEYHYACILAGKVPQEYGQIGLEPLYAENPENVSPVFNMISRTVERLATALGSWSTTANIISDIADYFTTEEQLKELEELVKENGDLFGTSKSTLENAVTKVKTNLEWSEKRLPSLYKYLEERNSATVNSLSWALFFIIVSQIIN